MNYTNTRILLQQMKLYNTYRYQLHEKREIPRGEMKRKINNSI